MTQMKYVIGDDELVIESDFQTIYGTEEKWDKNWKKQDNNGHWHFFASEEDPFPTLFSRQQKVYDVYDEDHEWEETRWFCKECSCSVTPRKTSQKVVVESKVMSRYMLTTTREVTAEEAEAWLQAKQK